MVFRNNPVELEIWLCARHLKLRRQFEGNCRIMDAANQLVHGGQGAGGDAYLLWVILHAACRRNDMTDLTVRQYGNCIGRVSVLTGAMMKPDRLSRYSFRHG